MNRMKGSFEETREAIEFAAREHFTPKVKPSGKGEECEPQHCWVYVEATFPTHAIVAVEKDGGKSKQYRIPYTLTDDGATLGEPERVELTVVVMDEDGETEPGPDDAALATRIMPALDRIEIATRLVQSSPEVKSESLAGLEAGVLLLLDAMSEKGADMRAALGMGTPDVDPLAGGEYEGEEDDPTDDAVEGKGGFSHVPADEEEDDEHSPFTDGMEFKDDGSVTIDADALEAQMAALRA